MTIAERKRARELKKVMFTYCGQGRIWLALLLMSLVTAIVCIIGAYECVTDVDDQYSLYMITEIVASFGSLTWVLCLVLTLGIGDKKRPPSLMGNTNISGDTNSGHFLCTLPFCARDLKNLRLTQWEITAAVNLFFMVAAQVLCVVREHMGYPMLRGGAGSAVIVTILMEVLTMFLTVKKMNFVSFIILTYVIIFLPDIYIIGDLTEAEIFFGHYIFEIFYGIPGIIILIICTILIALIGELYIKRKNISWNLH